MLVVIGEATRTARGPSAGRDAPEGSRRFLAGSHPCSSRAHATETPAMTVNAALGSVEKIGRYEVLDRIAEGEMFSVFKALDPETGGAVAIKVASPRILEKSVLRKRFEQEYTVARGLNHPNLVRALESGRVGGRPYLVMEYVDGPSLGDRIEHEGRLGEAEAVRILTEVANGLNLAHQRRIIHRDIKPDNILLTSEGQAKLADLGLAKDCDADEGLTQAHSGLGTPNFM